MDTTSVPTSWWSMTDELEPHRIEVDLLMAPGVAQADEFLDALAKRPAWHARAACRGLGPEIFYPGLGESVNPAMAICALCPVRPECLRYGLVHSVQLGIWGGTSGRTRRKIASRNKGPRTRQSLEDVEPLD